MNRQRSSSWNRSLSEETVIPLETLPGLFRRKDSDGISEYYFTEISHAQGLLHGLNQQRSSNTLCDVIICVDDNSFPCHRNVLAACSPYFLTMFTADMKESNDKEIKINGVSAKIMKQLIDFAYSSNITITQENAQQLLSAANLVQITSIIQACCNFLEGEMDPSNCLGIHCFAEAHVCEELSEKARKFVIEHFTEVAKQDEILLLPQEKLTEFINRDELYVESEEVVFEAILKWVKHDPKHRVPQLAVVLQFVRLPLMDAYFLFDKMDTEPLLLAPECRPLLDEAMKYHILKDRRFEMVSPRTKPRRCMTDEIIVYITGGEIYNKNYLNCVEGFNFHNEKWLKYKDLPFSRCHHNAVLSEDMHIYIAGGYNKERIVVNNVMRYERHLDKWIKVAPMNTPRAKFGMTSLDGYIYAIGGTDGNSRLSSVERYFAQTNRWSYVAPLNSPTTKIQATSLNGRMYAAGGVIDPSNQCVDTVQVYNPKMNVWQKLRRLSTACALCGLVAVRGRLYALGGADGREVQRYSPEIDSWNSMSPMVEARVDPGIAVIDHKIYALSGHDGGNSFYSSIEVYDIHTDIWSIMTSISLQYGRCRFACVAMGGN